MNIKYLFIMLGLCFGQVVMGQTEVSGKVDNYTGKSSAIFVNPFNPETVGNINGEGEFTLRFGAEYFEKLKKRLEKNQKNKTGSIGFSTLKKFQTRFQCDANTFAFSNGEQPYTELLSSIGFIVADLNSKQVNGLIRVASSKSFGDSQVFNPKNNPVVGYMLDWYYVEEAATVDGDCTTTMSTGSGDETYDRHILVKLDFQPGWNLVKYDISKVFTGKSGKKFVENASYFTIDSIPEDAEFLYFKK